MEYQKNIQVNHFTDETDDSLLGEDETNFKLATARESTFRIEHVPSR